MDGGYTEWGNWSACSVTCGTGQRIRTRECTNPAPAHGGEECAGRAMQTLVCTLPLCAGQLYKQLYTTPLSSIIFSFFVEKNPNPFVCIIYIQMKYDFLPLNLM